MKARQRKILIELMTLCNQLGGSLDGTSTSESKYRDRQKGLMKVYSVLLAVLSDHPDNYQSEYEYELAWKAIEHLKELTLKNYPDRNQNY